MEIRTIYIAYILILLTSSCREVDEFIPVPEDIYFDFGKEFTQSGDTLSFELDLSEPKIIRTPRGTEFVFKPEMFDLQTGASCSCEKVTIEIIELSKKRDYMVYGALTVNDNNLLISEGAYHISAFFQGKPLQLAPGHQACFWLPTQLIDPDMKLFFGEQSNEGFNWIPAGQGGDESSLLAGQWQYNDTTALINGYQCFSDRLSWIGINKFGSQTTTTTVCVSLERNSTSENTVVFAILESQKAILSATDTGDDQFCFSNLPLGQDITLLGIRKTGEENYEYTSLNTVIEENQQINLRYRPVSFNQLQLILNNL
ncbi:MAG: hypothetical protein KDC53_14230 [Saprospiraceae bacterium]|nr:hypothetical protein [Saprospiraceae bacterium]